ncbi:Eco57I restriction-modification methylase domain-containing protein [Pseudorhizobium flavum]|uniref:Eco57I restriction-modification methylase domain-containing protein n=1 Tax=Pseudorhizobium flavum TaxID=1335061 RepID=UPI00376FBF5A
MARKTITDMSAWPSLSLEGNLIAPAMIAKIDQRQAPEQAPEDYAVRKGLQIREEIATAFRVGQSHFDAFVKIEHPSAAATTRFISGLFKETFGYDDLTAASAPIALSASGRVPIVVVPPQEQIDRRSPTLSTDRSRSPAFALQDYLNDRDDALWGVVTNGAQLRLTRDNASLTRPAYIEADLAQMFANEDIASFAVLWLLIHRSRFGAAESPATDCALERWRDAGSKEGEAARDRLADQVQLALKLLGSGFLETNPELAAKLQTGDVNLTEWFNELLRLVYRLIFLMVAEDRNLLHPDKARPESRSLYAEGYSLQSLRKQCYRAATWDKHHDRYEGVKIVFRALTQGQPALALPALGGLFAEDRLPHLETARLRNSAFMEALYRLSWLADKNGMVPVNWRAMETEELGSVYESLLELQPQLGDDGKTLVFASEAAEQRGNQRKTTGSYYTPDSLVQALLDSALDPVLDKTEAEADDPAKALLKLSVIDPACGSGHFLLAAARRIATRLARIRAEGTPSLADFRHALRDVARCCIHGVDRNPMAVELTKVALWIETVDPGLPLGFFDAQIRCGDALLGVFDLQVLQDGIPDAAYKPLTGDDKDTARYYLQANRAAISGQGGFDFGTGLASMPEMKPIALDFSGFRDLPEDTVEQIGAKAKRFKELRKGQAFVRVKAAADLYVAAFLQPKVGGAPAGASERTVPTTEELWMALNQGKMRQAMVEAPKAARSARAFHWPLEFPHVMQGGGFDAVIGNPPWEKYTILEREFFTAIPEIVAEANAEKRRKLIEDKLKRSPILAEAWSAAQREASAKGDFVRGSGRFPQSAVGELNLYPLFAELATHLTKRAGWTGFILKSLMFTGSTWKGFTDHLVTSGRLRAVFDFKNWEMLFSSVGYHERYSLTTMGPERPDIRMQLAVGLTNPAQLSDDSSVIAVDRAFPRRVNPETGTLPQCETPEDLRILTRVAEELPTLGQSDWNARYTSGLHMTSDAAELRDREALEAEGFQLRGSWFLRGSEEFAPVYEGKFIHQYDHRFATFEGIPADKRFGIKAATINPTEDQKRDRKLEIVPRYWVRRRFFEENAHARRVSMDWNLAFRDTTNVISNFRTAVGCVVGPTAFNYKCPNVVIASGDAVASALFLSMFNSVPYDYLLRQKFYGANFTKSMLLQTFVVSRAVVTPYEAKLLDAVAALTNTSESVEGFCRLLGRDHLCVNDTKERIELRAWIDALYFDLFGFDADEVEYVFDTFPIWRDKSTEAWGSFYEKERTLAIFAKLKSEAA